MNDTALKADYINPFIDAVVSTFNKMCHWDLKRKGICLKEQDTASYAVSGIIGLAGPASGSVTVNFPEIVAIAAVNSIFGTDEDVLSSGIVDGVGEITNIIAGDAKVRLGQVGYNFDIGIPKMIAGNGYSISTNTHGPPCIVIIMEGDLGCFSIEISLIKNEQPTTQ